MSIWSDIQDRSAGETVRKEDDVKENLWQWDYPSIEDIHKEYIRQSNEVKDLSSRLKELSRSLRTKCKYYKV